MAKLIYKDGCEGMDSLSYIEGIEIELRKGQKALIYPKYIKRLIVKEGQIGKWRARVLTQLGALKVDDTNGFRWKDDTTDIGSKNQQHRHVSSGDSQRLRTEAGLDVADSRNAGTQGQRKRKAEVHSPGSAANSHSKGRRQVDEHLQSELADGAEPFGLGREWPSSDTDCTGLQKPKQSGRSEDSTEGSRRVHHRAVGPCQYGPASHAFRERLSASVQSRCYGSQEWYDEERPVEYASNDAWLEGAWWNHFPTVSPVHTRDDGLSKIMDGTTLGFHKWRNESIKAYGNAIVPQVMFRIFQAIESIQNENNHN